MYTPFPYQGKDARKVQLAVRIPQGLWRELKLYCLEHKTTVTSVVADTLRRHLHHRKYPGKLRRIK